MTESAASRNPTDLHDLDLRSLLEGIESLSRFEAELADMESSLTLDPENDDRGRQDLAP